MWLCGPSPVLVGVEASVRSGAYYVSKASKHSAADKHHDTNKTQQVSASLLHHYARV